MSRLDSETSPAYDEECRKEVALPETLERTPLYEAHVALGARMVDFAGWEMPLQYSSVLQEAQAVRSQAGLFDVSHMGRIHLEGPQATELLEWVVTNEVAELRVGRARYTCLCNEEGGIIDDAIYYRLEEQKYLLVCNAANRRDVLTWLELWINQRYSHVSLEDRTEKTAMIAFQGPQTPSRLRGLSKDNVDGIRRFNCADVTIEGVDAFVARTGYTGEDGFEFITAQDDALSLWRQLMDTEAAPCGLGARDVLRMEASFPLHGNDIDDSTTPLEAGLERFVHLEKEFVGVDVLREQGETGVQRRLVGLLIRDRHIARHGFSILVNNSEVGMVTSGTYSPTLSSSIALGYVPTEFAQPGQIVSIKVRNRPIEAEVVSLPFYSRKEAE